MKNIFILVMFSFIGMGLLSIALLIWNQHSTTQLITDHGITRAEQIIKNSLDVYTSEVNNYRIVQTSSEELSDAFIENNHESIYEELIPSINQAQNIVQFNLKQLRIFTFENKELSHFISIHNLQEKEVPTSKFHTQAFNKKIIPIKGLVKEKNEVVLKVLHYFAVFDLETYEIAKEGVFEFSVDLNKYLRLIKRNFLDTEVAFFSNKLKSSTHPIFFKGFDEQLTALNLEEKTSKNKNFSGDWSLLKDFEGTEEEIKKQKEEIQKFTDSSYQFFFIPLFDWNNKYIGNIIIASDNTEYQFTLNLGLWILILIIFLMTLGAIYLFKKSFYSIIPKLFFPIVNRLKQQAKTEISEIDHLNASQKTLFENTSKQLKDIVLISDFMKQLEEESKKNLEIGNTVSSNIKSTTDEFYVSSKYMKQLFERLKGTQGFIENGIESIQNIFSQIQKVQESSEKIEEINQLFYEISRKNEILGVNAGLEAAHSGKHGAGFVSISNEIKDISQYVKDQSKNIRKFIDQNLKDTKDIEDISQNAKQVLSNILNEIKQLFNEMSTFTTEFKKQIENISDLNSFAEQIKEHSYEQFEHVQKINSSVQKLDEIANHSISHVNKTVKSSAILEKEIMQLDVSVKDLSVIAKLESSS